MALSQEQNGSFRIVEQAYVYVSLTHMVGAIKPLFGNRNPDLQSIAAQVTDGSLGFQIFGGSIYLIALIVLMPRYREVIALVSQNKALLFFVGLILISPLWSDLPSVTMRRSLALFGTTIFGVYLAVRFSPSELLKMLAITLGLTAVASFLYALLLPELGIHQAANAGAWKGVLDQKNIFARTMVLGMLAMWTLLPQTRTLKSLIWAVLALLLFLVVMSESRTSWIAAVGLLLAVPFLRYLRRSQAFVVLRIAVVFIVGFGSVVFLVLQYGDTGLQAVGRDATFSGRTDIWASAASIGWEQPILGRGYRTFWTRGLTSRLLVGNGHNSFLDIWLELGFVGLGLFLTSMVVTARRILRRLANSTDRTGLFYALYLIFMVLFGMPATVFPEHATIAWVLYIAIALYLTPVVVAASSRPAGQLVSPLRPPAPAE